MISQKRVSTSHQSHSKHQSLIVYRPTPERKSTEDWYHYENPSIIRVDSPLHLCHPLSTNNAISLLRRRSSRRIVDRITTTLRLIAALRMLQLVLIIAIITLIAVERVARSLTWNRGLVRRSGTTIVRLIRVVMAVSWSTVLLVRSSVVLAAHPAGSVHWGHTATTTTAAVEAPVRCHVSLWKAKEGKRKTYENVNARAMKARTMTPNATQRPQLFQPELQLP